MTVISPGSPVPNGTPEPPPNLRWSTDVAAYAATMFGRFDATELLSIITAATAGGSMSIRAIAVATGVSASTVHRTLEGRPADRTPLFTIGIDGKKYPNQRHAEWVDFLLLVGHTRVCGTSLRAIARAAGTTHVTVARWVTAAAELRFADPDRPIP